ncbi:MAG: hypothetical protein JST00_29175 [Deltaproteobacteria bacterium]|nr:hypothetical protein [Deltaproteobacteria bacterium]
MARLNRLPHAAAFLVGALGIAACGAAGSRPAPPLAAPARGAPRDVASNVLFSDYAGTQACAPCHADRVRTWLASPMHNMTREIDRAEVKGPFDGTVFRFKEDTAKLETVGGARFMTLSSKKYGGGVYRLTRVIGGHYREDYAGVAVEAARPDAKQVGAPEEMVLPVSWVFGTSSLRYKGYSVMVKERSGLRAGPVWGETCIFCHNTPPFLSTVLGALAGPSARPYQGEVVDPLLPRARRAEWKVKDASALGAALDAEVGRLGHPRSGTTLAQAIEVTRSSFRRSHLVEVGIGCEACHLGAAEHVKDPSARVTFEPRSAAFEVRLPGRPSDPAELRAARINRICARCHQVLFSGYEPTWEGGQRHGNAGGSQINSGEARDMLLGACASKLSCVECHEPHASDATAKLRALPAAEKDALCTRCHEKYASADAVRAHSHHDPGGEGARCISCHMPKKNLALDGSLSRYHRIGSPTDPPRVILDRPLECALCHGDKSVESLVATMETWWKRAYDREALGRLYGDLAANALVATANRGKPHEQAVAFFLLGERRDRAAIPHLVPQLTHAYPLVRGYAKRALDTIVGSPLAVDLDADDAEIEARAKAYLAR